jgi:bis(5'-nucleosidyl)-tetraphosphatase
LIVMPIEKSAGAIVFRREKNKILYLILKRTPVVKRPDKLSAKGGYWDPPKGRIEKGETKPETIKREIGEETGIKNVQFISGFSTWVTFFYRAKGEEKKNRQKKKKGLNIFKIVTYYIFETKTKRVILSREHEDYAWLEYNDALKRLTYENTRKVLRKANKYISSI